MILKSYHPNSNSNFKSTTNCRPRESEQMDNFLVIIIHESREVTVREIVSAQEPAQINIKVLKKRIDEFGEAGGVIGTEGSFPQKAFLNLLRINWTRLFFSMLGSAEVPEDMKVLSQPDDDVGLRNESRFSTTIFSEIGKENFIS